MPRYLLIANQTLDSRALWEWASRTVAEADVCHFFVVVPATRIEKRFTWTEGEAHAAARRRLERMIRRLAELGAIVEGDVGDENPFVAAVDALRQDRYDEVVVSTLPVGVSAWLRLDVVRRLRREVGIPVLHVEARQPTLLAASPTMR